MIAIKITTAKEMPEKVVCVYQEADVETDDDIAGIGDSSKLMITQVASKSLGDHNME